MSNRMHRISRRRIWANQMNLSNSSIVPPKPGEVAARPDLLESKNTIKVTYNPGIDKKIPILLGRLVKVCFKRSDYGGEIYNRGMAKIQEKYKVTIWLTSFGPTDISLAETPNAEIIITPTQIDTGGSYEIESHNTD